MDEVRGFKHMTAIVFRFYWDSYDMNSFHSLTKYLNLVEKHRNTNTFVKTQRKFQHFQNSEEVSWQPEPGWDLFCL